LNTIYNGGVIRSPLSRWFEGGLKLEQDSGGTPSIETLLRQAIKSDAYKDLPKDEVLLRLTAGLYNALKEDKPASTTEETTGNTVIVNKEYLFNGAVKDAWIYQHKGNNYYYQCKNHQTNKTENGFSLKCGTNRNTAMEKAEKIYFERKSNIAKGVLSKSVNTKQLIDLFLKHHQKRIKLTTHRGLTQASYDAKIQKIKYWQRYIKDKGFERKVIQDIPTNIGADFANWLDELPKERYTDKPRSIETINHIVATAASLYKWAHKQKHIGADFIPNWEYMDKQAGYDQRLERPILWEEEYVDLVRFMKDKYCKDKLANKRELDRRKQYSIFVRLAYATGMRLMELRNLRWIQISDPKHMTRDRDKKINRSIYFPQTKTSRTRTITSPIAMLINELIALYKDLGVDIDRKSDSRVFFTIYSKGRVDQETWYTETTESRKLEELLKTAGIWDKAMSEMPQRKITMNSSRHHFATYKIVNEGWSYERLSLHLGNSAPECEKRYSKATAAMITAKNMKNEGLNKIGSYVMKDEQGKPIDKELQERLKDTLIDLASEK